MRDAFRWLRLPLLAIGLAAIGSACAWAQTPAPANNRTQSSTPTQLPATSTDQSALEKSFVEMLSGATLEGSFTSTGAGRDPTKLSREKYTIGDVRKTGDFWTISARIQYGEHDVTLPITVPIRWAADTPVIIVDNLPLPGFGPVSARVMFFADHYAGYWKHGNHGGHLFGVITRAGGAAEAPNGASDEAPASIRDPARREQSN